MIVLFYMATRSLIRNDRKGRTRPSPSSSDMTEDLPACNIHVVDLEAAVNVHLPANAQPPPKDWEHSQYSVEHWLRRAVEHHPWRVADAEKADLIFAAANFTLWCVIGNQAARKKLWEAAVVGLLGTPRYGRAPIFIARQVRQPGSELGTFTFLGLLLTSRVRSLVRASSTRALAAQRTPWTPRMPAGSSCRRRCGLEASRCSTRAS